MHRHFTEVEKRMANRRYSTTLVIRIIQIKIAMTYHPSPIRMAKSIADAEMITKWNQWNSHTLLIRVKIAIITLKTMWYCLVKYSHILLARNCTPRYICR